jgi:hypothetical protein
VAARVSDGRLAGPQSLGQEFVDEGGDLLHLVDPQRVGGEDARLALRPAAGEGTCEGQLSGLYGGLLLWGFSWGLKRW